MKALVSLLLIGCLALALATHPVKWCAQSEAEKKKCDDLAGQNELKPLLTCVRKDGADGCIKAIKAGEADAVTLDGGDIYEAGQLNYDLHPIIAEDYGAGSDTCDYAVAVAKAGTQFGFNDLRGKKSCHTGLGKSAGWNIPIGTLLAQNQISWGGIDDENLLKAVSEFFNASCVPGFNKYPMYKNLCELCKNDCSGTHTNPYYGYDGAFQCLKDGGDDYVAFVQHLTVTTVPDKSKYELLCKDGTRKSVDGFATCHLAKEPAHAVVSRKDADLADHIWQMLQTAIQTKIPLFSSAHYKSKDLLFKDSTVNLVRIPKSTDSFLYLGAEYMGIIRSLQKDGTDVKRGVLKWCAVGPQERTKCDIWSGNTADDSGTNKIDCKTADTVDGCIRKIVRKEADAMALDGGQVYTAGKCGLVPAMVEQYDEDKCTTPGEASSYYAVAVVKRGTGFSWDDLRGKKSCHTGKDRTAGWNVPMGLIHNMTNDCDFSKFFSESCAPGGDVGSPLCKLCVGKGKGQVADTKCSASTEELYYGYDGAIRCLVEGGGDVAFLKHSTVGENSDGNGPSWASALKSADFELLCPTGTNSRAPVTDYLNCNLAKVPARAVVTLPEMQAQVVAVLKDQESQFGNKGSYKDMFQMFQSEDGRNLLFQDSTKCLQEVPVGQSFKDFLGQEYYDAVTSLRQCSTSVPELDQACSFHICQQKATAGNRNQDITNGEKNFIEKRKKKIKDCLSKHGIECPLDKVPRIAVLGSGGGQRAQIALLGTLRQLAEEKLLDSVMYLGGVSGSTWSMSTLYKDPTWSAPDKVIGFINEELSRLSQETPVGFSDSVKWMKDRDAEGDLSLTDVWAIVIACFYTKEINTHILSEEAGRDATNPYPNYSSIEKDCLQSKPEDAPDGWFEMGPHECGFSGLGAFVESALLKSHFDNGRLIKKAKPMGMLQLQGICGSAMADGKMNVAEIKKRFFLLIDLIWQWIKSFMPVWVIMKDKGESDSITDIVMNVVQLLDEETLDRGDIIDSLKSLLGVKCMGSSLTLWMLDKETWMRKSCAEREQLARDISHEMIDSSDYWSEDHLTGISDVWWVVRHVFPLIKKAWNWEFGTVANFLYNKKSREMPDLMTKYKMMHLLDAGLKLNSPYPPVLRSERGVDLIISFDFSEGDPFETITAAVQYAKQYNKIFPMVVLPYIPYAKSFNVYDRKEITVVHVPLFNLDNCKDKEGIDKEWKEYTTVQRPWSTEKKIQHLAYLAAENVKINKEKILSQIKIAAERKKC